MSVILENRVCHGVFHHTESPAPRHKSCLVELSLGVKSEHKHTSVESSGPHKHSGEQCSLIHEQMNHVADF